MPYVLGFRILTIGLLVAGLSGCTSKTDAERALGNEGMTGIQVTGYNLFACSEDDFYHTGFTATNAFGKNISGTVCSGLLLKGATIRY